MQLTPHGEHNLEARLHELTVLLEQLTTIDITSTEALPVPLEQVRQLNDFLQALLTVPEVASDETQLKSLLESLQAYQTALSQLIMELRNQRELLHDQLERIHQLETLFKTYRSFQEHAGRLDLSG